MGLGREGERERELDSFTSYSKIRSDDERKLGAFTAGKLRAAVFDTLC